MEPLKDYCRKIPYLRIQIRKRRKTTNRDAKEQRNYCPSDFHLVQIAAQMLACSILPP